MQSFIMFLYSDLTIYLFIHLINLSCSSLIAFYLKRTNEAHENNQKKGHFVFLALLPTYRYQDICLMIISKWLYSTRLKFWNKIPLP